MIQIVALRNGAINFNPPVYCESIADIFEKLYGDGKNQGIIDLIPEGMRHNVFYTLAHHVGVDAQKPTAKPIRSGKSFSYQEVLAFDLDGIQTDPESIETYKTIISESTKLPTNHFTFVLSGNGLHAILFLRQHIKQASYFAENKPYYSAICDRITNTIKEKGLTGYADKVIFEPARILRMPETINRKPDQEDKPCRILQYVNVPVDFNLMEVAAIGNLEKDNVSPQELRRVYPRPDFQEIVSERGCAFLRWVITKPEEIHEPQAFDAFSILAAIPDTEFATFETRSYSAKELAKKVFDGASSSKSLAGSQFEAKYEQSQRYGGRRCTKINENWDGCRQCPHFGKLPTPVAIKSPEHIGSAAQGYWVYDKEGYPVHPHYGDLVRAFKNKFHYVSLAKGEVIYTYDDGYYSLMEPLSIMGWMQETMDPQDPVRQRHRTEFLAAVRSKNVTTAESNVNLFQESIKGKINLANGTLDVTTGTLTAHSYTNGFLYKIPYAYDPDVRSEYFLDWLDKISLSRSEIMETILDVMAYCLFPTYDDHVFTILIGEGKNGKSTLLHLIQEIIGKENFTNVSLQQLTNNRFAPSLLTGKLVNLCEEASGKELTTEQLNVIKTLSAGGDIMVERKGLDGYMMKNTAKLIFSMNKAPKFDEDGTAIRRRLLVIPFDYAIDVEDPTIEQRLFSEASGVLTILIDHIQRRLSENSGVFKVRRMHAELQQANKRVLSSGNYPVLWAQEYLDTSETYPPDTFVSVDEAYGKFVNWTGENGIKYVPDRFKFGKSVRELYLPPCKEDSRVLVKDVALGRSIQKRVFRKCKWRQ